MEAKGQFRDWTRLRPGDEIELLCLKGFDAIRARIPPHGERVVVRTGLSKVRPVPGELF